MSSAPSALLLIATGCAHCPSVLQSLGELIKEGKLASLEVVNIANDPQRAQQLNVRSVPWLKLGEFELLGLRSKAELEQWIEKASHGEATALADMAAYFEELMTSGEMPKVEQMVQDKPEYMLTLFTIMADSQASLNARIGVGAVIETLSGSHTLKQAVEALGEYTGHGTPRVRNDACYYLGLSQSAAARPYLQACLDDADAEVRECAQEALEELPQ